MKNNLRKILGSIMSMVLAASLIWGGAFFPAYAKSENGSGSATIQGNDIWHEFEVGGGSSKEDIIINDGSDPQLGYQGMPGDHDVQSLEESEEGKSLRALSTIPSKWDANNFGSYMPELKNQGKIGACWAMATMAAAEINLRKKGLLTSANLSEVQMAYYVFNHLTDPLGGTAGDKSSRYDGNAYLDTGNSLIAADTLIGWQGAALEEGPLVYPASLQDLPSSLSSEYGYDHDVAHLRNYYYANISPENGIRSADMQAAKQLIMEKGALCASYYALNSSKVKTSPDIYNSSTNAYYDSSTHGGQLNHTVAIVGWDDNFSASKFSTRPEGNGAWLVRNSWTTGGIDKQEYAGYFWLSYYNAATVSLAVAFDYDVAGNYDHNYQYDGAIITGCVYYSTKIIDSFEQANVFRVSTSSGGENLKAVSFFCQTVNTDCEIRVYVSDSSMKTNPISGTLKAKKAYKTSLTGYYTVDLDTPIHLEPGQYFSVVIKHSVSGQRIYIPYELSSDTGWFKTTAYMKSGQSFINADGHWDDMADVRYTAGVSEMGNARIKAYTVDDSGPQMKLKTNSLTLQTKKSKSVGITLKNDSVVSCSSSNKSVAKAQISGGSLKVTAGKKKGSATITVKSAKGLTAKLKVSVQTGKVTTKTLKISVTKKTITGYGKSFKIQATASPDQISTGEKFKVSTSNSKVATAKVNKTTGVVTVTSGKKKGTAKITISCGSKKKVCKVTVKK